MIPSKVSNIKISNKTEETMKQIKLQCKPNPPPENIDDQTPTPTSFFKNCEAVGLFQDLQKVNPFEETFKQAVEGTSSFNSETRKEVSPETETLNTPAVESLLSLAVPNPPVGVSISTPDISGGNTNSAFVEDLATPDSEVEENVREPVIRSTSISFETPLNLQNMKASYETPLNLQSPKTESSAQTTISLLQKRTILNESLAQTYLNLQNQSMSGGQVQFRDLQNPRIISNESIVQSSQPIQNNLQSQRTISSESLATTNDAESFHPEQSEDSSTCSSTFEKYVSRDRTQLADQNMAIERLQRKYSKHTRTLPQYHLLDMENSSQPSHFNDIPSTSRMDDQPSTSRMSDTSRKRASTVSSDEDQTKYRKIEGRTRGQKLNMTEEEKRNYNLERNRAAASRSRKRQKERIVALEERNKIYKEENQKLQIENFRLRNENVNLKALLLTNSETTSYMLSNAAVLIAQANQSSNDPQANQTAQVNTTQSSQSSSQVNQVSQHSQILSQIMEQASQRAALANQSSANKNVSNGFVSQSDDLAQSMPSMTRLVKREQF